MNRHLRLVGSPGPSIGPRLAVGFVYVLLAYIVGSYVPGKLSGLITIFMLLGLVYWLLIGRRRYAVSFFVRYHLLQGLLVFLVVAALMWLFVEALALFNTIPGVNIVIEMVTTFLFVPLVAGVPYSVASLAILGLGLFLAIDALRARTTELPWISDGVRHWV